MTIEEQLHEIAFDKKMIEIFYQRIDVDFKDIFGDPVKNEEQWYEYPMKDVMDVSGHNPNPEMLNEKFFYYLMNNESTKKRIQGIKELSGNIEELTLKQLQEYPVIVPPLELQNQFVASIKICEDAIERIKKRLAEDYTISTN